MEQCQDKIDETNAFSVFYEKAGNVGDDVTFSGRPFHVCPYDQLCPQLYCSATVELIVLFSTHSLLALRLNCTVISIQPLTRINNSERDGFLPFSEKDRLKDSIDGHS